MPPSPAMRYSPGREPRATQHRRGRSFEAGVIVGREKDEDLALFNEMQNREKEDFLLQSDDLEDIFSTKLRQFSDFKLGIAIPIRGESSDLLNAEEEKNDYEWLLTPPDTPLFPSLDDEPPPIDVPQRGRPRSQRISITKSSTMEKSYRSSRGSASPSRLSSSPRSGNSTFQSRGTPSSVRNSSPTPSLHPASPSCPATPSRSATSSRPATPSRSATSSRAGTPSGRPSTPPSKSPTPPLRSSTPNPRRLSTGSTIIAPSGRRGTSPVTTSRGNSASPKIRAWQTNIPGFSSDAPPNLRTSLSDRPATYVRGSSPASRNGRGSSPASGNRRQSMSPTAFRSISSSRSHDIDPLSSQNKGSIASSADDDLDSLQSHPVGSLDRSTPRKVAAFSNNRAVAFSKKSAKLVSSSSAPKRSFDSAIRQMDHRKTPQNMFRPLLSSVPSSTFYVGKSSSTHRPLISRNSSVTTSSNASSDLGTSFAPDTEESDHIQDDMASEFEKMPYSDGHEEVFVFDKMDVVDEDTGNDIHDESHDIHDSELTRTTTAECVAVGAEDSGHPNSIMEAGLTSEDSFAMGDCSEIDGLEDVVQCLECGCRYYVSDEVEKNLRLCPECSRKDKLLSVLIPDRTVVPVSSSPFFVRNLEEEEKPFDAMETRIVVPGSPQVTELKKSTSSHDEDNAGLLQTVYNEQIDNRLEESSLSRPVVQVSGDGLFEQQEVGSLNVGGGGTPNGDTRGLISHHSNNYPNMRVDLSEGTGISILLKRTSSSKGTAFRGRTFSASTISYGDLSYARDSSTSMRSSIGHSSFSASSSVDFGPARQTDGRVQRQSSAKKLEMEVHRHDTNMKPQSIELSDLENHRHETNMKLQSIGPSSSGLLRSSHQMLGLSSDTIDDNFEVVVGNGEYDVAEGTYIASEALISDCTEADVSTTTSTRTTAVEEGEEIDARRTRVDASTSEMSTHAASTLLDNSGVATSLNSENCASHEYTDLQDNGRSATDANVLVAALESSLKKENIIQNSHVDGVDDEEIINHSSLITVSEVETGKGHHSTSDSTSDDASHESKSTTDDIEEPSIPNPLDSDLTSSVPETNTSNHAHDILEETVMVECRGRSKARSLTLEEATDTILLCSSIVHDLAYQAATIAIEKERSVPLEGSQPTVTILGKSNPDKKEPRGRTVRRRSIKSQKGRQKQTDRDSGSPASENDENENENENVDDSLKQRPVGLPPNKADGMKPPKLESKCNCTIM